MADARAMLAVVVLVGVAHGFVVEQPERSDSAWRFSVDGSGVHPDPGQGGHLVEELQNFQVKGFGSYNAGRGGGGGESGGDQFSDHSTLVDSPDEQISSRDLSADVRFEQEFDTQAGSSSRSDEGWVYNAKLQSTGPSMFEKSDVDDSASAYDYNRFSTRSEVFPQFNRQPSSANSYVLGVPEEREKEARPEYVYDARAGRTHAGHGGKADDSGVSTFTSTGSIQQQQQGMFESEKVVPVMKGHEGPVSYYTPASDRNGAFVFYDTRSDEEKKSSTELVEGYSPARSASFASSGITSSSASTSSILAPQRAPQSSHGCPNSYWAEHVEQWPAPLKITTLVSQAFGRSTVKKNLEIIYGTTTLFQALLDARADPYSKLLRHAVAALLNSHVKSAYTLRPNDVAKLFNAAVASKAAAAAQAQKFENENHAFGDIECN